MRCVNVEDSDTVEEVSASKTLKTEVSKDLTSPIGVTGIEGYYDDVLSTDQNITLSIDVDKQTALQNEVDRMKHGMDKYEVTGILINLKSGYIESIASSNRTDRYFEHRSQT